MTNWRAMQTPIDKAKGGKVHSAQIGVKPRYLAMGSWKADLSKGGVKR